MNEEAKNEITLLKCPFCGNEPEVCAVVVYSNGEKSPEIVRCRYCHVSIAASEQGRAVEKWNSRLIEDAQRWIPVTERLPERGYRVMLYDAKSQYMMTGEFDHVSDRRGPEEAVFEIYRASDCGYFARGITHWRPLPTPPEANA